MSTQNGSYDNKGYELDSEVSEKKEGSQGQTVGLERTLGVFSGVAIIVGTMIGSGIFISPKGVLTNSGSVALSLIVWAGCGVISVLGALTYAELGTLVPMSGGEYPYLLKGFGAPTRWKDKDAGETEDGKEPSRSFFRPLPAFLFAWVTNVLLKPSSFAIIALAFADYTCAPFFDDCGPPKIITKLTAGACILVVTYINCKSVRLAAFIINILTITKIAALLVIIVGGIIRLSQGHTENLKSDFEESESFFTLSLAFYNGLWAYDGWNNLNYVIEELKNPRRNVPICLLISIPLVTVLYLLVNISYFTVLSGSELLSSSAVAVTWSEPVLGVAAWIIPFAVSCSTFGACNGSLFSSGRVNFVASREGHTYSVMSMVSLRNTTPMSGIMFVGLVAIAMIIPGDIESLIDFFSFTAWMFYGLTAFSLIVLRFVKPYKDKPRDFKVPLPIPVLVIIISIYLIAAPIASSPDLAYLYATIFIFSGTILYVPLVYYKLRIPGLVKLTQKLQLLMSMAPEESKED